MEQRPWRVGDIIRKLRLEAGGWKLEQLSAVAHVDVQVISRIELGKTKEPKKATLNKIAGAFGLKGRDLEDMVPAAAVRLDIAPEVRAFAETLAEARATEKRAKTAPRRRRKSLAR